MPLFALIGRDGSRGIELRLQHREAHLANLRRLADAQRVRYGGPLIDGSGQPCGSLLIFEAEDLAAARRFAETDPYVVEGVFQRYEVLATRAVFPEESG